MAVGAKAGKKWQSPIWDYSDALTDKSKSLVKDDVKMYGTFKG